MPHGVLELPSELTQGASSAISMRSDRAAAGAAAPASVFIWEAQGPLDQDRELLAQQRTQNDTYERERKRDSELARSLWRHNQLSRSLNGRK